MNLMEENRKHRKKRKLLDAVILFVLTLITIAVVICGGLLWGYGRLDRFAFRYLNESYYIVVMLVTGALALSATRLWKPFLRVFGIIFTRREYMVYEVEESNSALRLTGNVMMLTGMMITSICVIMNLWYFPTDVTGHEILSVAFSFAISLIAFFYGLAAKLLFMPFQSKLEVIVARLQHQGQSKEEENEKCI